MILDYIQKKIRMFEWDYPLVNVYITIENHHAINGKFHYKWSFAIAILTLPEGNGIFLGYSWYFWCFYLVRWDKNRTFAGGFFNKYWPTKKRGCQPVFFTGAFFHQNQRQLNQHFMRFQSAETMVFIHSLNKGGGWFRGW